MGMTHTLAELIEHEPKLEDFNRAAVQSARNNWPGWVEWFPSFSGFTSLVGPRARCEELATWAAYDQAVALLVDRHQVERDRIEQRQRQQQHRLQRGKRRR